MSQRRPRLQVCDLHIRTLGMATLEALGATIETFCWLVEPTAAVHSRQTISVANESEGNNGSELHCGFLIR